MFKNTVLGGVIVLVLAMAPSAYAGKRELATYYPAPHGEYKEVQASQTLKAPVHVTGTKTAANSTAGEIWVEKAAS